MPRHHDESARLLELARAQQATIRDPEVRDCWYVIVEAIAHHWLSATGPSAVDRLADEIDSGGGVTVNEYSVDVDYEGGDPSRVVVQLVDERYVCPRAELVYELRRLDASCRGAAEPPPPKPDPPENSSAESEHRQRAPGQAAHQPDDETRPPDLAAELQRVLAALTPPTDPAEAQRVRAEARALLARWGGRASDVTPPDLRRAVEHLATTDRSRLVDALRTFADWAEQPHHGGAAVDRLLAGLERTLGPVLAAGRQADQRATKERMRSQADDAITRRLREAGAPDPTDHDE